MESFHEATSLTSGGRAEIDRFAKHPNWINAYETASSISVRSKVFNARKTYKKAMIETVRFPENVSLRGLHYITISNRLIRTSWSESRTTRTSLQLDFCFSTREVRTESRKHLQHRTQISLPSAEQSTPSYFSRTRRRSRKYFTIDFALLNDWLWTVFPQRINYTFIGRQGWGTSFGFWRYLTFELISGYDTKDQLKCCVVSVFRIFTIPLRGPTFPLQDFVPNILAKCLDVHLFSKTEINIVSPELRVRPASPRGSTFGMTAKKKWRSESLLDIYRWQIERDFSQYIVQRAVSNNAANLQQRDGSDVWSGFHRKGEVA